MVEFKAPKEMKNATHLGIHARTLEAFIAQLNAESIRLNDEGFRVFATQTAVTPRGDGMEYTAIVFYFKVR